LKGFCWFFVKFEKFSGLGIIKNDVEIWNLLFCMVFFYFDDKIELIFKCI
jgi:hypothetical protein